jgi:hypothetical protein
MKDQVGRRRGEKKENPKLKKAISLLPAHSYNMITLSQGLSLPCSGALPPFNGAYY